MFSWRPATEEEEEGRKRNRNKEEEEIEEIIDGALGRLSVEEEGVEVENTKVKGMSVHRGCNGAEKAT